MNLTPVDTTGKGWYPYKSQTPLAGDYLIFPGKPTQELKDRFPFVAATGPGGFRWLVKAETWVYRLLLGLDIEEGLEGAVDVNPIITASNHVRKILVADGGDFREWQKRAIKEVVSTVRDGRPWRKGLIVGLGGGKTLFTLLLCQIPGSVYVAPRHLHSTIREEAAKWALEMPAITTPESAKKLVGTKPPVVIIDECLSVKNPQAARSRACLELAKDSAIVAAMTGTPLSAKAELDMRWLRVCGDYLPEAEKHMKWLWGMNPHYRDLSKLGIETRKNWKGESVQPLEVDGWEVEKLSSFLADNIFTVDISDILAEIPEAQTQRVYLPTPRYFRAVLRGLLTEKSSSKRLTQARSSTAGFVYSDSGDVIWLTKETPTKITWVKNFLADNPGEPVVVFANWRAEIERLAKEFPGAAVVHEGTASREVTRFTAGDTDLMVCSASITEGMNLQRSRIGVFLSNSTNPTKRIQAKGRLFRQGQKRGVVFYDLLCSGTLDEKALDLIEEHAEASDKFVESQLSRELERMMR